MIRILTCVSGLSKNAGPKAKEDIVVILKEKYGDKIIVTTIRENVSASRIKKGLYLIKKIIAIIKNTIKRDIIIIQYPMANKYELLSLFPKNRTIIVIHDLIGLRFGDKNKNEQELKKLKKFKYVIAHNEYMKRYLVENGLDDSSIFTINAFDYITKSSSENIGKKRTDGVAFAGNLCEAKSPFLHQLDVDKMKFKLYLYGIGISKDVNEKELYEGSFNPDELPDAINCKVGLVWDGCFDESDELSTYKNYSKYNNPHKLSCYIAAGIPVIVWKKSAIAKFVLDNNIGYTINNIYDINKISYSDYDLKKKNVASLSKRVKNGYYTQLVFDEIFAKIGSE